MYNSKIAKKEAKAKILWDSLLSDRCLDYACKGCPVSKRCDIIYKHLNPRMK